MGRKITGLRVDIVDGSVSVRALSKSMRGTQFTVAERRSYGPHRTKEEKKSAVKAMLAEVLAETVQQTL